MAEPRYGLLVFDWDGTLVDSTGAIVECILGASRDMGLPASDPASARYSIGLGMVDALRVAVPSLPAERYREFAAHYRKHFVSLEDRMAVFEGMPQLLAELRDRGYLIAIATGKGRRGLDRALHNTGLGEYFTSSRCADETSPKPHPAMLHELMAELAQRPERTLMIGDTSHDMQMASNADVDGVGVSYGAHSEESLLASHARACVSSVQQLRSWLTTNA